MPDLKRIPVQAKLRVERARASNGVFDVVMRTFKRFSEDDGAVYAASLTYYLFFSLFPMLIFATAVLGMVTSIFPDIKADLLDEGLQSFPLLSSMITAETLADVERAAGSLAVISILLALYSGSGAVAALGHALNRINRVENEGNFFQKRLASLKWLAIFAGLVLVSLALGALARWAPAGATLIGIAAGLSLNVLIFLTAFTFLPRTERRWKDVLPGALIAGTVFELLKYFGSLYLSRGAQAREATFGAFATAAGLLVAAYLLAQVTLLAAEVNAVLEERRLTRQSPSRDRRQRG